MHAPTRASQRRILRRIRIEVWAALALASIAVVLATSGVAGAAVKLITGKQIAHETITGVNVKNLSIAAADLKNGAVTAPKVAPNAIGSKALAANSVTSAKIADGSVSGADVADGSITGADLAAGVLSIADGSISASKLAADSVGAPAIASDAVGAPEIASDAVGAAELAADSVGAAEIAADAVGASEIATDGVGAAEIATDSVGTLELAPSSVTGAEIATDAVTASRILDGAVGNADLDDEIVTGNKMGPMNGVVSGRHVQSIVGSSGYYSVDFDGSDEVDPLDQHDESGLLPHLFNVTRSGTYLITAYINWDPCATGANYYAVIADNGGALAEDLRTVPNGGLDPAYTITYVKNITAPNTLSLAVSHTCATPINATADFTYHRIGS